MAEAERVRTASVRRWLDHLANDEKLGCAAVAFAEAWLAAIAKALATRPLTDTCLARLRREMRLDVHDQLATLADGASAHVIRAWCAWYPKWVAARLGEIELHEPLLFATEEDQRAEQSRRDRALDAQRKQRERDARTGRKLLAMMVGNPLGGIRWEPEAISRQLAGRGPAPKVKPMADALVRIGAAEWQTTPSGKPWALVLLTEHAENDLIP